MVTVSVNRARDDIVAAVRRIEALLQAVAEQPR